MIFELAFVGFITGLSYVSIWGFVDGVFGQRTLFAIALVFMALFVASLHTSGIESTAGGLAPLPYWVGLFIGSFAGMPMATKIKSTVQVNGTPWVWAWYRGERA